MTWSSILWLLASTFDQNFTLIPDIREWEKEFKILEQKKIKGYYYGSDVTLPPIGVREIFEGQARFSQLQYLYLSSGGKVNWETFNEIGMLEGVYKKAFELFLKILEEPWPETPYSPLVGLFLILCDISINPTDGFPFNIHHFESFVISVDPGMRFLLLCQLIQTKHPSLKNAIQQYSNEEYLEVSETLCKGLVCPTPHAASNKFRSWATSHPEFLQLLEEDKHFTFSHENMPIRVFFARFLLFQNDKYNYPEYFCWPGVWSVGDRQGKVTLEQAEHLFEKHRALFVDREDGDVYPRTFHDKDDKNISQTFNSFYSWNSTYELTRQWIMQDGDFNYDFLWLTSKFKQSEVEKWANDYFESSYGVRPSSFKVT